MYRRSACLFGIAIFTVGFFILPLSHAGVRDEPELTVSQVDDLKDLPYSLSRQTSLVLRRKHIDSVVFDHNDDQSHFGYVLGTGIMRQGLWLRLTSQKSAPFSKADVTFHEPIEGRRYNSIVLWMRTLSPNVHFRLAVSDTKGNLARTVTIPYGGLPAGDLVQIAVPYSRLLSKSQVDWNQIHRIRIEYGTKTVRNNPGDALDLYGVAFIRQEHPLPAVRLDDPYRKAVIAKKTPKQKPSLNKKTESAAEPEKARAAEAKESTDLFPAPRPTVSLFPLLTISVKRFPVRTVGTVFGGMTVFFFVFYVIVLWRRRPSRSAPLALERVLHEVEWPESLEGDDALIWREFAKARIGQAWLSVPHSVLPKNLDEEIRGESFLKRQIDLAAKEGVPLIPSVCFVRTTFNYENFLSHPDMFLTKKVLKKETHLSDEDLRTKHVGYFPAWIPPYWQKKNRLPQRILVSYGKLPGAMFTTDSVQYNLKSPILRDTAVRLLKEFAKRTNAVRVEGATALLNATIKLYWGNSMAGSASPSSEFWSDVITRVRQSHPEFKFIADDAGLEFDTLRSLGFDYCENDRVRDVMVNQVLLEKADRIDKVLAEQRSRFAHSVYNLTPLLTGEGTSPGFRDQNTLASVLLSLLPGRISVRGDLSFNISKILRARSRSVPVQTGDFALLKTDHASVLAFSRIFRSQAVLVIANFSKLPAEARVRLDPIFSGLDEKRLYLFNDVLHGTALLKEVLAEKTEGPAMAVWGQDLKLKGLPASMSGLSLKIISVNLSAPIRPSKEAPKTVHASK